MSKTKAKRRTQGQPSEPRYSEDARARRLRIAEAAYYKAKRRGFAPGAEEADWLEAERETDGEQR